MRGNYDPGLNTLLRLHAERILRQERLKSIKADYIRQQLGQKKSWREIAKALKADVGNLHRFAKKAGIVK
jgi:hypothetical protein